MEQHIWFFQQGTYKVYIEDIRLKNKFDWLKGFNRGGTYCNKEGKQGWDYTFSAGSYDKVARLLKLPLKKKNKNQIMAGKLSKVGVATEKGDFTHANSHQVPTIASKSEEVSKDTTNMFHA